MIVRIVPIVPVVSKNFETIGKTETLADFHMIVSIASNTEDARSSAMFLGPTTEFWRDIRKRNGGHQSQSESPGSLLSYSLLEIIFSHLSPSSWSHIRARTLTSIKEVIITLSRARRTIESAFGILTLVAKWRIFRSAIRADVTLVEKIVQATICLHNYLCLTENANYKPAGFVDCEDSSGNIINFFSRVQPEFLSYCFPDIHNYKLIFVVLRKFVVNYRIFLHFFHKERRV